jgi:hypothetical protein
MDREQQKDALLQKMESVRKELHYISNLSENNLLHPDVLAKSAELDRYIVNFHKKKVRAEKTL